MNDKEEQMIIDNLKLIYHTIKKMSLSWETEDEFQDYYDYGLIGLINGVRSFKESAGYKPSTFLTVCIKNEIGHCITNKRRKKRFNEYGRPVSLDTLVGDNKNVELSEFVQDTRVNIEEEVERKILIENIAHRINKMKNIKKCFNNKNVFWIRRIYSKKF